MARCANCQAACLVLVALGTLVIFALLAASWHGLLPLAHSVIVAFLIALPVGWLLYDIDGTD